MAGEPLWVDVPVFLRYVLIMARGHVDIIKDPIKTTKLVQPYATLSLPYKLFGSIFLTMVVCWWLARGGRL